MKTKDELLTMLFARLDELQHGAPDQQLTEHLKTELSLLYDILGDDVPSEYWEQIEEQI